MGKLVKDMTPEELERQRERDRARYKNLTPEQRDRRRKAASKRAREAYKKTTEISAAELERRREINRRSSKKFREKNPSLSRSRSKQTRENNIEEYRKREAANARRRRLRDEVRQKDRERCRAYRIENIEKEKERKKRYSKKHRKALREKQLERHHRKKNDPEYFTPRNLRLRLSVAVKRNYKTGSAVRDLGCSIDEFRVHIESQFDEFMSWENYGVYWQFDHIYPLDKANLEDRVEFLAVANWRNYQPLEAGENSRKGNKVTPKASRLFESLKKEFST